MLSARQGLAYVLLLLVLSVLASSSRVRRSPQSVEWAASPASRPPTCLLSRVTYNSGEMIERTNPCDFCFCYKGEVLCWKKQCPPPPPPTDNCYPRFVASECCPRYMCESMSERFNFI